MALIPLLAEEITEFGTTETTTAAAASVETSRTYMVDWQTGRVGGFIDGLEALRQAIYKTLQTERFAHLIYSWAYGFEGDKLLGQTRGIVEAEAERYIAEALTADDRIDRIEGFTLTFHGKRAATAAFTAVSNIGDVEITTEVTF